jgi:hypothetical protein
MATGLESRKASSVESAIERRLADTCRRIRLFDTAASLLLVGSLIGGYALLFAVFDLSVQGADTGWTLVIRWIAYSTFMVLFGVLVAHVLRRLARRVNPYYAARRLEETVPEAKNSIINWLDLHDEPLPPALHKTLGSKAAQDIDDADPELAIDRGPTWVRLGIFTAVLLGILVLFAVRPGQFLSLFRRAFLPFYEGRLITQVRIQLLRPEEGDAVVTEKQPLLIIAQIEGRVPEVNQPGAPTLHYRYQADDKFVALPMQADFNGNWTARLLPDQIGSTGLWYRVSAGDAETPVYQVAVRAQPFVERYEITYKYRPYLNLPPEQICFPNEQTAVPFIKRHRGTQVALVVRTNRTVRQGNVALATAKSKRDVPTEVLRDDPQAFRAQWSLEQSGDFFVSFTSVDGEVYNSRIPFPMDVLTDTVPTVTLTRPGHNVTLPANGTLEVEGAVDDDLGLKELTLRLEVLESGKAVALKPQTYRPGTSLDLDGKGVYPVHLDYLDLIKLDELRTPLDLPAKLNPGTVVRYWLEATDNSDYPNKTGNVGKSTPYEIKILPPEDDDKQKEARERAGDRQQKHNARQDKKLADEKQERQDTQNPRNRESRQADQLGQDLQNEVKKHQPPNDNKGGAKGNEPNPGENKPGDRAGGDGAPSPEPKDQKPSDPNQAGNTKSAPQPGGAEQKPGETKDAGGEGGKGSDNQPGGGGPQNDPMAGAGKDGKDAADQGMGKGDGSDGGTVPGGAAPKPAQGKESGPDNKPATPQSKGQGEDSGGTAASAQAKPGGGTPKSPGDQPPQGLAKPEEATGERSISKAQGPATDKKSFDPRLKDAAEKNPGMEVGSGKADVKAPPRDPAKDVAAVTKDEGPPTQEAKVKEPTPQDVEHLKDLMQHKGGLADLAEKALTQMSKEAPDPKVRELAKQALDQAGPKTVPGTDGPNASAPKTAANPPPGATGDPSQANPKEIKPPPGTDTKPASAPGSTSEANIKNPNGQGGKNAPPGGGPSDDGKADPARKDLANFGGSLQLEDFIKRATPEYRAQAGISPEEWQRFLARAAEYDELLRKMQRQAKGKTPLDGRATGSQLGPFGPTRVQTPPGAVNPSESGQAVVPPELQGAVDRFKARPGPKR